MLRLPLEVTASGGLAQVEIDSIEDVLQSVGLLLDTRPGERRSVPDYGLGDPLFALDGVAEDEIRDAVEEWEERADLTEVESFTDGWEQDVTVWADLDDYDDYDEEDD